tara:strand:+ start:503 stop:631 length:129 start_codon:yes stop_codon:yes gene_type:complete
MSLETIRVLSVIRWKKLEQDINVGADAVQAGTQNVMKFNPFR